MSPSTGRTGRISCFALSILMLGIAIFLLTDAVQVDTEPQATKLIVLAQVLATGSVALMIGALVWTMAARGREPRYESDRHPSAPDQHPGRHGSTGYGEGPAGYGGGPAQEAWIPPPG